MTVSSEKCPLVRAIAAAKKAGVEPPDLKPLAAEAMPRRPRKHIVQYQE